jgi:hypothetical protein
VLVLPKLVARPALLHAGSDSVRKSDRLVLNEQSTLVIHVVAVRPGRANEIWSMDFATTDESVDGKGFQG